MSPAFIHLFLIVHLSSIDWQVLVLVFMSLIVWLEPFMFINLYGLYSLMKCCKCIMCGNT